MAKIYVDANHPMVQSIVRAAYPNYTGRKFSFETRETVDVRSNWDGGSRDYYVLLQILPDGSIKTAEIPQMSAFDRQYQGADDVRTDMVPNLVIVRHSIFCGKDMGITMIVHPTMMNAGLLPMTQSAELSDNEKRVLYYTRTYKSSYAGIKNYRQHESGMALEVWEATKAILIEKGLLDKRGALTTEGKNAAQSLRY